MKNSGLRIAIDGRPALWPRTGIGTIASNVLERIQDFDKTNQYFAYFNNDPVLGSRGPLRVQCRWGGPRQKLLWANVWLPRQLKRDGIDVFITFLDKELPYVPTHARIVSMVHDLIPSKFPDVVFRNRAHRFYYNTLIRASIRRSATILTNSNYSRQEIVRELGADETKVRKITLGAAPAPLADRSQVAKVLRRYNLRQPFVIALGSTEPRKNNIRVIEAMRHLHAAHLNLQLVIVGSNWRGRAFDPAALDDRVCLPGHVPDDELPVLLQAAEILVFPSLHEGFGFPVLEAMAAGIPVVSSNVTAIPEVAGDAALLVDPNSAGEIAAAMGRILQDRDVAADLSRRGRARAGHFRWEITCAELASLCESLMTRQEWQRQPVTL